MPTLTLFVGTNGSGKSTIYNLFEKVKKPMGEKINPDDILKEMNGDWNNKNDIAKSGIIALKRISKCIKNQKSFNWEMTIISHAALKLIKTAKNNGFTINLYFVGVESSDIALERIANRVKEGGHGVDADLVKYRRAHMLDNIKEALQYVDTAIFCDNTTLPKIIARYKNDKLKFTRKRCAWSKDLSQILTSRENF